jgi:hypothetical protein
MRLTLKPTAVSVAFGTVSFFMADENRTVRVDVSQEALAKTCDPPPTTKAAFVEQLATYRRYFAKIAALKYAGGDYRTEVRVLVVNITPSDL